MGGKWLIDADRDRLSGWPETILERELIEFFTLSEPDLDLIAERRRDANRLGFAIRLCALRFLGFFPRTQSPVPQEVIGFLAGQLAVPPGDYEAYAARRPTRAEHEGIILTALDFRRQTPQDRHETLVWLTNRALEHDRPLVLLRLVLERLKSSRILRPGLDFLERDIASARQAALELLWEQTRRMTTKETRVQLDALLIADPALKGKTRLSWLAAVPHGSGTDAINRTLDRLDWLHSFGVGRWDIGYFTSNRRKHFHQLARHATNQTVQRMSEARRYPMLVAFLAETRAEQLDFLVDQFDRCLAQIQSDAVRDFERLKQEAARTIDDRRQLLAEVGRILLDAQVPDEAVRASVFGVVPQALLKRVISDCDLDERPENDWPADRIATRFGHLRRFTPRFLRSVSWKGAPEAAGLLRAVSALVRTWGKGATRLPETAPVDFIPVKWRRFVFPSPKTIDRKYYELCALWELRQALRAGTVWPEGARRYSDPSNLLIRPRDWPKLRAEALSQTGNPSDAGPRLKDLTRQMEQEIANLNRALAAKVHVSLDDNGELVLDRLEAEERPPEIEALRNLITDRLPQIELSELLIDIDQLTRYSRSLTNFSTYKPASQGELPGLYSALLSQSGNFGFARMAQMTGIQAKTIANRADNYLRMETLERANSVLVNFSHRHPLTKTFGDSTTSSSDGQRFVSAARSLTERSLPKYFGRERGFIVYTWVSDQFLLYGTKIIPATVRDATVILDGILGNQTELPILEHSADTHGYTEITFALFSLLGLQFSPRIKDIGAQRLYAIGNPAPSPARSLLKGKINTSLIEAHWDDLMRLAGSLKLGTVSASAVISRMHNAPRKNPLVRALQEYGRLNKTIFALRYLASKDYRRRINGLLNNGETSNSVWSFVFSGRESKFFKHTLEEQTEQAMCVTLVVSAITAWNTVYIDAAVKSLKAEGHAVDEKFLKYVSTGCTEHINPFGKVTFPVAEIIDRKGLRPLRNVSGQVPSPGTEKP